VIGSRSKTEAIATLLNIKIWPRVAIDHDQVAEKFRVPDGRDFSFRNERLQESRTLAARGKIGRILFEMIAEVLRISFLPPRSTPRNRLGLVIPHDIGLKLALITVSA
jgi:hypothetical protein